MKHELEHFRQWKYRVKLRYQLGYYDKLLVGIGITVICGIIIVATS